MKQHPLTSKKKIEVKIERRISVKEYAALKNLDRSTITRRIKAGLIRAEQPAPGYRIEIIL